MPRGDIPHMYDYRVHLARSISEGTFSAEEGEIIQAYISEYMALKNVDPTTLKCKYSATCTLVGLFHDNKITLDKVKTTHILQVVSVINQSQRADNYRRNLVSLMKSFAGFLGPDIDMKKIQSVKLPKVEWKTKKPENMLSKEEVIQVLAACGNSRDRCFMAMVYDGSCRVIELLRLNWSDLIHDSMGYYIDTKGKTGRQRKIRFTSAIPYIEQWQKDYPGKAEGGNPVFAIFQKPYGRLTRMGLTNRVLKIRDKTGIGKLIPSIMRSTRITHDVAAGQDVQYIMLKNWGNLKTSMLDKYTNLSGDYIDAKALEYAGLKKVEQVQQADPMAPVQCSKCHTVNEPGNKHCRECGKALTRDGEDELSMIRDVMTPEEWISFWQWRKDHPD